MCAQLHGLRLCKPSCTVWSGLFGGTPILCSSSAMPSFVFAIVGLKIFYSIVALR